MKNYEEKETILYLDNVELGYGSGSDYKTVLKDINMIEKNVDRNGITTGQTIAIVGRSGRGKSTLFKSLTGLVKPKEGKILITDLGTSDNSDAKIIEEGDIGFVDQKYTLFRHKTVDQILMYAMRKSKSKDKSKIIDNCLLEWGLLDQRSQYPSELSGGQRQRTAILEQILSPGHFIVMDEPTSGLDVSGIEKLKDNFRSIISQHELNTLIFSTHLIEFAVEMADIIYFIGHPKGERSYSTVIKKFDLREMGLAWTKYGPEHTKVVDEIKGLMIIH